MANVKFTFQRKKNCVSLYSLQTIFMVLLLARCVRLNRVCVSYSKPGDVILGGLFPIHYVAGPGQCTDKQSRWGTSLSEAMIFAVEQINSRDDILPNITLGYDIRDDCRSEDVALWHALSLVNGLNPAEPSGLCLPEAKPKVFGIVGTAHSTTSVVVAKAAAMYNVPVVSYGAAADELGDSQRFPFFLRTIPQNSLQIQTMIDIIDTFGWAYVSLLHGTESEYLHGALRFQEIAPAHGICVAYSAAIRSNAGDDEILQVVSKLDQYPKAKVVVVIGEKFTGKNVMHAAQDAGMVGKYQWIGGFSWGYLMAEEGLGDISDGAIFVRDYDVETDGFQEYVRSKVLAEPHVSPWYKDLAVAWMEKNNCTDIEDCPLSMSSSGSAVKDAVDALVFALQGLVMEKCSNTSHCPIGEIATDTDSFLKKLFNVNFTGVDQEQIRFDSLGNAGGKFVVTNLREGSGEHRVGLWVSAFESVGERLELKSDLIRFVNKSGSKPRSICTEECENGYIIVPLEEKCCYGCLKCHPDQIVVLNGTKCEKCKRKEWPDDTRSVCQRIIPSPIVWSDSVVIVILTMCGLGIVLSACTIIGLLVYTNHPLIKASSRELSSINVASLTLTFSSCLVLLAEPTQVSCILAEMMLALCTTLIYAPTLLKVNRIFRIFTKARKSTQRPKFTGPKHQVIACLVFISVQVVLSILSAILSPSTPVELIFETQDRRIELYCSYGAGFIVSCVYNLLLVLACCFYAFKARKVPSNFNESKFIAISVYSTLVLSIAAVPVYVTAAHSLQKVATLCFAIMLNAYITLVCQYLPKLYAVKYMEQDDMSTRDWRGTFSPKGTNQIGPSTSGTTAVISTTTGK